MKFRKLLKITSRGSSITNSFVQAIIPSIQPTDAEIEQALKIFQMSPDHLTCVYCGNLATDVDHLRPLVREKQPTGYINEIRNLVPSCGRCNQSKGGSEWRSWIVGNAPGSPKTRGVSDLQVRIERLEQFEAWGNVKPLPMRELVGSDLWKSHWDNLNSIEHKMREAQQLADRIQAGIQERLKTVRAASTAIPESRQS